MLEVSHSEMGPYVVAAAFGSDIQSPTASAILPSVMSVVCPNLLTKGPCPDSTAANVLELISRFETVGKEEGERGGG